MKFKTLVLVMAAATIGFSSAESRDMKGKYGLGYFNSDAPVGGRIWVSPKLGVDVGVGFEATDVMFEGTKESATSLWFEAGFPYVVFSGERANFFVRPGVMFGSLDDRVYGTGGLDDTWSLLAVSGTLGAELFFGENFSLEAGHGIKVSTMTPPDEIGSESMTTISSFGADITYFGFHFYFK